MSFGVTVAEVIEVTNTDDGINLDNVWAAAEVGKVVDSIMFENMVQGGINWALGHANMSGITYSNGMTEQENFDTFESLRIYQSPKIEVAGLENGDHVRGVDGATSRRCAVQCDFRGDRPTHPRDADEQVYRLRLSKAHGVRWLVVT